MGRGGERYGDGVPKRRVFVYAAGGYYCPGKDDKALRDEMLGYIDRGYRVVKMKIGGASLAEDQRRIEAVLGVLKSGERLAVRTLSSLAWNRIRGQVGSPQGREGAERVNR